MKAVLWILKKLEKKTGTEKKEAKTTQQELWIKATQHNLQLYKYWTGNYFNDENYFKITEE